MISLESKVCSKQQAIRTTCFREVTASTTRGVHIAPSATRRDALLSAVVIRNLVLNTQIAQAAAPPIERPKPFCGIVDVVPGWAYNTPWQEDVLDFAGGKTWYRYVNYVPQANAGLFAGLQRRYSPAAPDKLPLLVISGGPGLPSSYLEPLELMAGVGRQVIFYDQVGCGNTFLASNNTCPPTDQLVPDLYLQQIDAVRNHLKLERCHLYGQGIGGMLALSYAAARAGQDGGVVSVSVSSTPSSYTQLIADRKAALQQLQPDVQQQLLAADDAGQLGEYGNNTAVWQQYVAQYVCRFPAATASAPVGCARWALQRQSRSVYEGLAGRRYFTAAGSLRNWDVEGLKPALQGLSILVSRGEYDEVSEESARNLITGLPGSKLATSKAAGSFVHIDDWEPHLTRVEYHLCAAEGSKPPTAA